VGLTACRRFVLRGRLRIMQVRNYPVILLFGILVILFGCKSQHTDRSAGAPKIVAMVNRTPITGDDIVFRMGGHEHLLGTPLKDKILDDIILDELLYQQGIKLGLDKDDKFQGALRMMELRIEEYKRVEIANRVRDTQIYAKVSVSDKDIKDYYEKNKENIETDLHIGLLYFPSEDEAKNALMQIQRGTTFEKVASSKMSHGQTGMRPKWDLGFLHWNQISPALLDTVYSLKKGETSDVKSSGTDAFYLIKVIDRKKNTAASFAIMQTAIENRLHVIKAKEAFDQYVNQLKKEAKIEVLNK